MTTVGDNGMDSPFADGISCAKLGGQESAQHSTQRRSQHEAYHYGRRSREECV